MDTHITRTCSAAFYYLYNIRRIRPYLSREATETLIHAFITSRLDYCNSLVHGIPSYQLQKLQWIQNAALSASDFQGEQVLSYNTSYALATLVAG